MNDGVKAGQVWQHKNTGGRWEFMAERDADARWVVLRSGEKTKSIPEWLLTEDYILVKDSP